MKCLEEPGCACVHCEQSEKIYRMKKQVKKKKKEEDEFLQECIQLNKTNSQIRCANNKETVLQTIYVIKYKDIMMPISVDYIERMRLYPINPNITKGDITFSLNVFNRLDALRSQLNTKKVKRDKYNVILPYSLCFYLKDRADSVVEEWCDTISYLHIYKMISHDDGVFEIDVYNTSKLDFKRI